MEDRYYAKEISDAIYRGENKAEILEEVLKITKNMREENDKLKAFKVQLIGGFVTDRPDLIPKYIKHLFFEIKED